MAIRVSDAVKSSLAKVGRVLLIVVMDALFSIVLDVQTQNIVKVLHHGWRHSFSQPFRFLPPFLSCRHCLKITGSFVKSCR